MKVSRVAITNPLVYDQGEKLLPEEFIAFVARIGKVKDNPERLLRYLIKHSHWSPFEHVYITFKIETSRAIAAQMLRHRSFTFQELSQRYEEVIELEPVELRKQAESNRQSSSDVISDRELYITMTTALQIAQGTYKTLIEHGVARECARMVLPLCTKTTVLMTGSVRSWIHYLSIRDDEHAQKEHREIAQEIKKQFCQEFPTISKALYNEESV